MLFLYSYYFFLSLKCFSYLKLDLAVSKVECQSSPPPPHYKPEGWRWDRRWLMKMPRYSMHLAHEIRNTLKCDRQSGSRPVLLMTFSATLCYTSSLHETVYFYLWVPKIRPYVIDLLFFILLFFKQNWNNWSFKNQLYWDVIYKP